MGTGGLSSRGTWAPQCLPVEGLALPSSNAAALALQKGLSRPVSTLRGPLGYRDHVSQPKRQDLESPDLTVLTRKHPRVWTAFRATRSLPWEKDADKLVLRIRALILARPQPGENQ